MFSYHLAYLYDVWFYMVIMEVARSYFSKNCTYATKYVRAIIFRKVLHLKNMHDFTRQVHGEKSVASIASDAIALVASECSMQIM